MSRKSFLTTLLTVTAVGGAIISEPSFAQTSQTSNLNISPKRVVFAGPNMATAIYIFTRGEQTATYRIELIDRVMLPNGEIVAVKDLPENVESKQIASRFKSAAEMIQYTPRRITLAPGQSQAIRLRLLRPAQLPDGEYRTTLTVSALPPEDTGLTVDQAVNAGSEKLSIQAIALFGISIPVIVRNGQLTSQVKIDAAQASGDKVQLKLARTGLGSVYGDIKVREKDAKGDVIGSIRGISVYDEVDSRLVSIPLTRAVRSGEPLFLTYHDDSEPENIVLATDQIRAQ